MSARSLLAAVLGTVSVCCLGCSGDYLVDSSTGTIRVVIETGGDDPDPDGYTVQVDGNEAQPAGLTASIDLGGLAAGNHTLTLAGVAPNCSAAEGLVQTVTVSNQAVAAVRYTISCAAPSQPAPAWTSIQMPAGVTAEIRWDAGRTIWGTSASDLFVAGRVSGASPRSGIWHYDGAGWTEQVSRVDTLFNGIWGFSGTDVYAVGNGTWEKPNPAPVILHYDGLRWSEMAPPVSGTALLSGVWGASAQDVYAAGRGSPEVAATELLTHFDGTAWQRQALPVFGDFTGFTDLAGTSSTDVWAIGSRQTCEDCNYWTAMIVHFDGQSATEQFSKNADEYHGVWAVSSNDVWVVGQNDEGNANVLHYDGSGWTRGEPLSTSQNGLQDVWARSSSDVYAVGPRVLLHHDGTSWSRISDQGGDRVWGTSGNDVFILRANEILHGRP